MNQGRLSPHLKDIDLFPELRDVPADQHSDLLEQAAQAMWHRNWWWFLLIPAGILAAHKFFAEPFFAIAQAALFAFAILIVVPRLLRRLLSRLMRPHLLRILPGHCRNCGYDMRATPERCPECGKKVEKVIRNN